MPATSSAGDGADGRARRLTDASELRALAHPVRVALLELLARDGELTATQAGEALGESPANASFHLRTLAKHGFVEEVPGASGRQRPWRRVDGRLRWEPDDADPAVVTAADGLSRHMATRAAERRERWEATKWSAPAEWRDAAFVFDVLTYLTPDELAAVADELLGIVDRFAGRLGDPGARPAGAAPVSLVLSGHPLPPTARGN